LSGFRQNLKKLLAIEVGREATALTTVGDGGESRAAALTGDVYL